VGNFFFQLMSDFVSCLSIGFCQLLGNAPSELLLDLVGSFSYFVIVNPLDYFFVLVNFSAKLEVLFFSELGQVLVLCSLLFLFQRNQMLVNVLLDVVLFRTAAVPRFRIALFVCFSMNLKQLTQFFIFQRELVDKLLVFSLLEATLLDSHLHDIIHVFYLCS